MAINVLRGGKTANNWSGHGWNTKLGNLKAGPIFVRFEMASKGGGVSDVMVKLDKDEFERIAKAMMRSNPKAAIKAFAAAMQDDFD